MTLLTPPGVGEQASNHARATRLLAAGSRSEGVAKSTHCLVSAQGSPSLNVDISVGVVFVVPDSALQGSFSCVVTATETLAVDAGESSGIRRDLVVALLFDQDLGSSVDDWKIFVVKGDTSGVDPAIPTTDPDSTRGAVVGHYTLARLRVPQSASTIQSADIDDLRSVSSVSSDIGGVFSLQKISSTADVNLTTSVTNITTQTISIPSGWTEYDIEVVGWCSPKMTSLANTNLRRAQFFARIESDDGPAATYTDDGNTNGTSKVNTVPVMAYKTGLTADATVKLAGQITAGANNEIVNDGWDMHVRLYRRK